MSIYEMSKNCPHCGLPLPPAEQVGWYPYKQCLQTSTSRKICDELYMRRLKKTVEKHKLPLEPL